MSFFNKFFGKKKEVDITTYQDFWAWFQQHEKGFFKTIKEHNNVDENCLSLIVEKLQLLNENFYAQVGMADDNTADLVITTDGNIMNFVFVDEILATAPKLNNWVYTNLKQATSFEASISMYGYDFDAETISFYSNPKKDYPDEIDITLVHKNYNEDNKEKITTGTFLFLDTILGEFEAATLIDSVDVKGLEKNNPELIPIDKLQDFLRWREKEFVEKYKGLIVDDSDDTYLQYEAETKEGLPIIAILNQTLLEWDAKSSHPWMMVIEIKYENENDSGMPDDETFELMGQFDDELTDLLPNTEGYLNIGRQTGDGERTIYFACKEFKKSSKTTHELIQKYANRLSISYEIYKDKYWMTMNRYGV
jgi:Family of unknown function (DUF695)